MLFEKASYDKLLSEVPKYKLITPSVLSDRLRVRTLFCLSFHLFQIGTYSFLPV